MFRMELLILAAVQQKVQNPLNPVVLRHCRTEQWLPIIRRSAVSGVGDKVTTVAPAETR